MSSDREDESLGTHYVSSETIGKTVQLSLLGNPIDYRCQVEFFAIGHGEMGIQVSHIGSQNDMFLLRFRHVTCFSGFMRWRGVRLRTGNETEYEAFVSKLTPSAPEPLNEFAGPKYYQLYIFEAVDGPVQFIASDFEKVAR